MAEFASITKLVPRDFSNIKLRIDALGNLSDPRVQQACEELLGGVDDWRDFYNEYQTLLSLYDSGFNYDQISLATLLEYLFEEPPDDPAFKKALVYAIFSETEASQESFVATSEIESAVQSSSRALTVIDERPLIISNTELQERVLSVFLPTQAHQDFMRGRFKREASSTDFYQYVLSFYLRHPNRAIGDLFAEACRIDPLLRVNDKFNSAVLESGWQKILSDISLAEEYGWILDRETVWIENVSRLGLDKITDQQLAKVIARFPEDQQVTKNYAIFCTTLEIEVSKRLAGRVDRVIVDHRNK